MKAVVARRQDVRVELVVGNDWTRAVAGEIDLSALIVLSGSVRATIGSASVSAAAPWVLLANPGASTDIQAVGDDYRHVGIILRSTAADAAVDAIGLTDRVVSFREAGGVPPESVRASAARLAAELETPRKGEDRVIDLCATLLAVDLIRAFGKFDRDDRIERSRVGMVDRRIRRAVEFMHDNYSRDLAVGEIAAEAFLSEFHFARLFKRVTGQTPYNYLAGVRLAAAERLLAETDLAVGDIGGRVGYQSPSHFAKVFRAVTGLSPSAFRDALVR